MTCAIRHRVPTIVLCLLRAKTDILIFNFFSFIYESFFLFRLSKCNSYCPAEKKGITLTALLDYKLKCKLDKKLTFVQFFKKNRRKWNNIWHRHWNEFANDRKKRSKIIENVQWLQHLTTTLAVSSEVIW